MTMLRVQAVLLTILLAIPVAMFACTPAERQDVKSAIDAAKPFLDAACLLANQALPDEEALKICKVAGPLLDLGKTFLATARTTSDQQATAKLAQMATKPCGATSTTITTVTVTPGDAGRTDGGR